MIFDEPVFGHEISEPSRAGDSKACISDAYQMQSRGDQGTRGIGPLWVTEKVAT